MNLRVLYLLILVGCLVALVGCMVPPKVVYHPRPLQPDNCGTPDEPKECMPFVRRPPPIIPVYSEPLPVIEIPAADIDIMGPFPPRPHVRVSVLNADGSEIEIPTVADHPAEPDTQ